MGAAGEMVSDMADMKRWVKLYVEGKTNGAATQRARLDCLPIGDGDDAGFGLGIACSNGWYGYTGGLPGYNTAAFEFPATGVTIVAWVTVQADTPKPGVANAIFRDIGAIMTPANAPLAAKSKPARRSTDRAQQKLPPCAPIMGHGPRKLRLSDWPASRGDAGH